MGRRKKGEVRKYHGSMCMICGKNCGKGGGLRKHVENKHKPITYKVYKTCFVNTIYSNCLVDVWQISGLTATGKRVFVHVWVRKFVKKTGPREVTKLVK